MISQELIWCRSLLINCWCRGKSQFLETQGSKKEITILTISLNHSLTGLCAVYIMLHSSGPCLYKTKAQTTVTGKFRLLILEKIAKYRIIFFIVNTDDIIPTRHYFWLIKHLLLWGLQEFFSAFFQKEYCVIL